MNRRLSYDKLVAAVGWRAAIRLVLYRARLDSSIAFNPPVGHISTRA